MTELIEVSRSDCNVTQSCFTSQHKFNDPSCGTVIDGELEALVEGLLETKLASDFLTMTLEELETEAELARIEVDLWPLTDSLLTPSTPTHPILHTLCLHCQDALRPQPRRANNQTTLARQTSSVGSRHNIPSLSTQVHSALLPSKLTLAQLGDIIGQSCLTSFHTPSSLPQHQLFVLHPTQCTDNHSIKEQKQRKI
ncbi:hypothetical protein BLNAU_15584 [Blattamonas nauphoetae]|uniref:Uncharacterized protein n=1 Tax=Blattamonas nauphoetae TaxID=2049346 RepID=A0ABQ9XGS6_9EUKA|nr:hypothetical protein BLNAU_15584 [Blattamonas nauphoetae]